VAREFPGWHCWRGIAGLVYARKLQTSPPVVLRAEDPTALRDEIRGWVGRQRGALGSLLPPVRVLRWGELPARGEAGAEKGPGPKLGPGPFFSPPAPHQREVFFTFGPPAHRGTAATAPARAGGGQWGARGLGARPENGTASHGLPAAPGGRGHQTANAVPARPSLESAPRTRVLLHARFVPWPVPARPAAFRPAGHHLVTPRVGEGCCSRARTNDPRVEHGGPAHARTGPGSPTSQVAAPP
jgi:hypothetical protein